MLAASELWKSTCLFLPPLALKLYMCAAIQLFTWALGIKLGFLGLRSKFITHGGNSPALLQSPLGLDIGDAL